MVHKFQPQKRRRYVLEWADFFFALKKYNSKNFSRSYRRHVLDRGQFTVLPPTCIAFALKFSIFTGQFTGFCIDYIPVLST